jgi:hypothetical protein
MIQKMAEPLFRRAEPECLYSSPRHFVFPRHDDVRAHSAAGSVADVERTAHRPDPVLQIVQPHTGPRRIHTAETSSVIGIFCFQNTGGGSKADCNFRCVRMLDRVMNKFGQYPVQRQFPFQIEPTDGSEVCLELDGSACGNGVRECFERFDKSELFKNVRADIVRDPRYIVYRRIDCRFQFVSIGSLRAGSPGSMYAWKKRLTAESTGPRPSCKSAASLFRSCSSVRITASNNF